MVSSNDSPFNSADLALAGVQGLARNVQVWNLGVARGEWGPLENWQIGHQRSNPGPEGRS